MKLVLIGILVAVVLLVGMFTLDWIVGSCSGWGEDLKNIGVQTEEDKEAVVAKQSKYSSWDPEYGNLSYNADGSYKDSDLNDDLTAREENLFWIAMGCFLIVIVCVSTRNPIGFLIALVLLIIGFVCLYAFW